MGKTRFDQVVGKTGLFVGAQGSEVQVASTTGQLYQQGSLITVTAAELNALSATGLDATELGYLDGVTAGTVTASKAVVVGANKNVDVLAVADLKLGAGAGTSVTSTAAELNILDGATLDVNELNILDGVTATAAEINAVDISANSETIDSGAAASVVKTYTAIDNTTSGAGAITLAAPDASMIGRTKIIEMTVDNGDVTLSLANVTGGSAATTCTWANVNEALILVGGANKWHVVAESGVVLS